MCFDELPHLDKNDINFSYLKSVLNFPKGGKGHRILNVIINTWKKFAD